MAGENFRARIEEFLSRAQVRIGGDQPWDIQVLNEGLFPRVLANGSLGLGEAYMDGWWECERLDEFFCRILKVDVDQQVKSWKDVLKLARAKVLNQQSRSRAYQVGERHYDAGNDLYQRMLDSRMIYSCGYWNGSAADLDEAQEAKLDLICRKLGLRPGMRVLDIGCGWGGACKFAAERYGVEAVGITISKEQARWARESCRGLPVEIRLEDYRSVRERFDRILSVGMFEHVGYKNYPTFMKVVRANLKEDGLFLLHTIGGNSSVVKTDCWIDRYIFPNSMLPSGQQICRAAEHQLVLEDWHSFGSDYDPTLLHWCANFEQAWPALQEKYSQRFYRMWRYYLLSCAGTFRARRNQVWQIVFSPGGVPGGYTIKRSIDQMA